MKNAIVRGLMSLLKEDVLNINKQKQWHFYAATRTHKHKWVYSIVLLPLGENKPVGHKYVRIVDELFVCDRNAVYAMRWPSFIKSCHLAGLTIKPWEYDK